MLIFKTKINKIVSLFLLILFLVIGFSFTNKTNAATTWYYTMDGAIGTTGRVEVGGFTTKPLCLADLKTVNASWNPSPDCYLAGSVKITNFSPVSGKIADTITVNGENFVEVSKIFFGTIEANSSASIISDKLIKVDVPPGVTNGDKLKIKIITKNKGEVTSSDNFTISNPTDMKWWYKDIDGNIKGPFESQNLCASNLTGKQSGFTKPELDKCFEKTITDVNKDKDTPPVDTKTTYTMLAPLPGLGLDGTSKTFDTAKSDANPCPFGIYLNILIKIFLGICGVLAVIMIVWGGIQYMTSELISNKEEGRKSITNAVFGLMLALGSYIILNTLNPDLLNICLNNLPKETISISEAPPSASDFNPNETIPNGAIKSCAEGISKPSVGTSGGTFTICNSIANSTKTMINKAWTEGYKISGWGFRSYQTQVTLRTKNGCPDVYKSPSNTCKVPTAIPGTSMHESGLAIDFTCDGKAIQAHDNKCFVWLQKNASNFLKNLPSEPWHWSTNGS